MKRALLELLRAPGSGGVLLLEDVTDERDGEVWTAQLRDAQTGRRYPVARGIPRFVEASSYADSFGFQWNRYAATQLDSRNGTTISAQRFWRTNGWAPSALAGERVLDAGCGAGRFTEIALAAGADVVAIDYSSAADACWANHGPHPRLHVVQADLYALPFAPGAFDRVYCYGVLQHTPDVAAAFRALVPQARPGGWLSVDLYRRAWCMPYLDPKYWYRPLTRRLNRERLLQWLQWYIPRWLPVSTQLAKIPTLGPFLNRLIPCWNYTGTLPLTSAQHREWAILDTFDALSARYDQPQTVATLERWCRAAGLTNIVVERGGNGVIGNGRRPLQSVVAMSTAPLVTA